jgi:hypothetical protein
MTAGWLFDPYASDQARSRSAYSAMSTG